MYEVNNSIGSSKAASDFIQDELYSLKINVTCLAAAVI